MPGVRGIEHHLASRRVRETPAARKSIFSWCALNSVEEVVVAHRFAALVHALDHRAGHDRRRCIGCTSCAILRPSSRRHRGAATRLRGGRRLSSRPCRKRRRLNTGCLRRKRHHLRDELEKLALLAGEIPVEPGQLVVLAVGVVVAVLRVAAARRPPSIIGTPCDSSSVAIMLRFCWRAQRVDARRRPLALRRRNSTNGCCRCRRGCLRRWPRCACRCSSRDPAA